MVMDPSQEPAVAVTRTIRCTEDNAPAFAAAIRSMPDVHALVKELHAGGWLAGLRDVTITLRGAPASVDRGLAAIPAIRGEGRQP